MRKSRCVIYIRCCATRQSYHYHQNKKSSKPVGQDVTKGKSIVMVVWGVRSSAAESILKCLTTAFTFDAAIKQTDGNTKREPYNRREHT
jgi:hypothetical protein